LHAQEVFFCLFTMKTFSIAGLAACNWLGLLSGALAQGTSRLYDEPNTGLTFLVEDFPDSLSEGGADGGYSFGYVLPGKSNENYEYVGYILGPLTDGQGWAGLSHGGPMTNALLLMAWPNDDDIVSSFRYAT
jgi:cellobiose dehydrogenase (acceptor)